MFFASIESVLSTAGGILIALLALMFMVVIHELGHYSMGKLFKFKITEFAIGFGKPIYKKKRKNGEYFSIRPIPMGGFCAFQGEDEESTDPGAFNNQKPWKRLIVLFAGAFFNFVSAILIIALTFTFYGDVLPVTSPVYVSEQSTGDWQDKDIILSVDGKRFSFFSAEFETLASLDGNHTVVIRRYSPELDKREDGQIAFAGEEINFIAESELVAYAYYREYHGDGQKTPTGKYDEGGNPEYFTYAESDYAHLTVANLKENYDSVSAKLQEGNCVTYQYYRVKFSFFDALGRSFTTAFDLVGVLLDSFGGIFTGATDVNEMGGPVTVISTLGQSVQFGIGNLMYFVCLISANLAVFNLLPIPSLDGSRMLFTAIEWVRGKPINRNVEGIIHFVGIVLLFAFAIFVDVRKLF